MSEQEAKRHINAAQRLLRTATASLRVADQRSQPTRIQETERAAKKARKAVKEIEAAIKEQRR